jgi:hypothetical protein
MLGMARAGWQAHPRVLVQEAHGHVERGAAPHLQAVEPGSRCATNVGDRQPCRRCARASPSATGARRGTWCRSAAGASARGPLGEALGAQLVAAAGACRPAAARSHAAEPGTGRRCREPLAPPQVAVDDDVGQVRQQPRGAVAPRRELEQFRGLVQKAVVTAPDWNAGLFTTFSRNGMLVLTPRIRNSRSARSMRRQACVNSAPSCHLHQQRVVIRVMTAPL